MASRGGLTTIARFNRRMPKTARPVEPSGNRLEIESAGFLFKPFN
jgi:hypothetical protein